MDGVFSKRASAKRIAAAAATVLATLSFTLLADSSASASNPLMKSSDRIQVLSDGELSNVKGSGAYADYYGYYGYLNAYYAYQYSYLGRYYYASNSAESTNAYYNAYQYSYQAYINNVYAYVYSYYGY